MNIAEFLKVPILKNICEVVINVVASDSLKNHEINLTIYKKIISYIGMPALKTTEEIITQILNKRHIKELANHRSTELRKESKEFVLNAVTTNYL